jgi:hypothetical protein
MYRSGWCDGVLDSFQISLLYVHAIKSTAARADKPILP